MKWITRERPKIDRIACPWLIKNFIDAEAEFIYIPFDEVMSKAAEYQAIPYDIPGVEFTHYGDECTFDYLIRKYDLRDPALHTMAVIVRGADTDRHHLASQSSGLWAISAGLSHLTPDDGELLIKGMMLYDALYAWSKFLQEEKHTQNSFEYLLLDVYEKFLEKKASSKKIPAWAKELKAIIQDKIDTDLSLSLKEVSETLQVHPSYLSREFSKHFDNLTFGEYLRKLRIEKAIQLLENTSLPLTQVAYLTGFSDQSHFTRIFKKHTGKNPSTFKKELQKSKTGTKS